MYAEEQEWLLDALAELVGRLGAGPWLERPVVLPDAASFPDTYDDSPTGVRTLLRRLAAHAGLELRVELFADPAPDAPWPLVFDEIREGAIEVTLFDLRPKDELLGHAVHAIAHAFHDAHQVGARPLGYRDAPDSDGEGDAELDARVGVTAVYLGFGVLAAREAHRYSAEGMLDGGAVHTAWRHDLIGEISAEGLAWLVALQTLLCDESTAEVKAIERVLPPNPQAAFRRARRDLAGQLDTLRERLGLVALPERKPRDVVALADDPEGDARAEAAWNGAGSETETLVYRVPLPGPRLLAAIGGFVPGLLLEGLISRRYGHWAAIPLLGIPALAVLLASVRRPRCSSCRTRLPREATTCRGCGGIVAGDASSLRDVLDRPGTRRVGDARKTSLTTTRE